MAVVGLRDILEEIADGIRDTLDSSTFPIQVEIGHVLFPSPPVIDVFRLGRSESESAAFGDIAGALRVRVRARVLTADYDSGASLLISFCDETDPLYLLGAIESDPTLNSKASSLRLLSESDDTAYETPDGTAHLGCHWDFLIMPARS